MTGQPDYSGHCMIALYPPAALADALAIDGGLPASGLHLTVAYTGDAADVNPSALIAAAEAVATRSPITAKVSGHARFTGGEQDCIVALVTSPELDQLRRDTEAALAEQGIPLPSEFGFCPHIALQYIAPDDPSPVQRIATIPIVFDAISAVHGKDRTDCPFEPPLADAAAEAYLTGWALSGGPATSQLDERCTAAVTAALEHAGDPRILEVTLNLGKLDGAWAKVYERREDLISNHVATVKTKWRKLAGKLDVAAMVRSFRRDAGLTETASRHWTAILKIEAKTAAAGMLAAIRDQPGYDNLVLAIEAAIAAAAAEGKTAALAVAAEMAGKDGFDWAKAFAHMYEPLTHLEDLPGMADPWVTSILNGLATDIGNEMARLASDGGTYQEMIEAVEALTTGADLRAIRYFIDLAMSGSANQGALDLYASEGIEAYDVLTAGDDRVCPYCQQQEDDNPHTLIAGEQPVVPGHGGCRCAVAPSLKALPFSAFSTFLKTA